MQGEGSAFRIVMAMALLLFLNCATQSTSIAQEQTTNDSNDRRADIVKDTQDLLKVIEQQQIDEAFDGIGDVARKRAAIETTAADFARKIVDGAFDQAKYDAICRDYVTYRNICSPRLSGRIVRIGPDQPLKDIATAASKVQPGDLILLGEGEFLLPDSRTIPARIWNDVAIVGQSPKHTTLKVVSIEATIRFADRLSLQQLRVDCNNQVVLDLRTASAFHLRGCELFNYNSGYGGSNSLFANDSTALIEGCSFEGRSGRRASSTQGGSAFDLRGNCALFVRQSQFIDNEEIVRASFPCVFDGCTALSVFQGPGQVRHYTGARIWLRDSADLLDRPAQGNAFKHATDDLQFVKRAAGHDVPIDAQSQSAIEALAFSRRLPYWIGLIRHDSPEVRAIAATQLSKLVGMEVSASPPNQNESNRLEEGTAALAAEVEYTRLIKWFESNRAKLKWNQSEQRYIVQGD